MGRLIYISVFVIGIILIFFDFLKTKKRKNIINKYENEEISTIEGDNFTMRNETLKEKNDEFRQLADEINNQKRKIQLEVKEIYL